MPQKQISVINQEILDNNMPSTLITFTPNPTPTHYACIFIMYLDVFLLDFYDSSHVYLKCVNPFTFHVRSWLSWLECLFPRMKLHV